jgi:hypothetical protein
MFRPTASSDHVTYLDLFRALADHRRREFERAAFVRRLVRRRRAQDAA